MFRNAPPVSAFLALALAATPAGAATTKQKRTDAPQMLDASFEPPDTKALLREAKDLWLIKEDFSGALAKFNAAVTSAPNDPDARLQRGHFLEVLSNIVVPRDRATFEEGARTDFEHIVAIDPESVIAGVARDGLTRLAGEPLIATRSVTCPEPAVNARARGNVLYGARRYADAVAEYTQATAGCPEASHWWVELADAFYELEDYERAKAYFLKALSVDPWNREAHRYLSDTHVQLGDNDTAVHQLVLAVVADPTYEAGWSALRAYATAIGHKWTRVYGDRKPIPGKPDHDAWVVYATARASARKALGASASALAVEREAVAAALKAGGSGPFWSMMARAQQGGFLDEAIFFHLLDAKLGEEYPAFREKNAERLTAYLETVILR